jgi:polyhydroxybutyrate depolymerase
MNRHSDLLRAAAALMLVSVVSAFPLRSADKLEKKSLTSRGKPRTYVLSIPEAAKSGPPAPLLLCLHGSGRTGASIAERWTDLAAKERIVVAGPDALESASWGYPGDGPDFLRDVVENIAKSVPIDRKRVYLFGHSAGASFAIQMALVESEYFAAAAVSAGAIPEGAGDTISFAKRKIPIAIFVGTNDPIFTPDKVRKTRDMLSAASIPVELTEIPRHDHNYYKISNKVNDGVWSFLKSKALSTEPRYEVYAN